MATTHFHQVQFPSCSERHLSTIKTTLHRFKAVLDESDEPPEFLTSFYQALWDTLQSQFDDIHDEPATKKARSHNNESDLLEALQSSLHALITSARNDLTMLEPEVGGKSKDSATSAIQVSEENEPKAASRIGEEGLAFQGPKERSFQTFADVADLHDVRRALGDTTKENTPERYVRTRLRTWMKALELCKAVLKLKRLDEEDTQYYEEDLHYYEDDLSQGFQSLSLCDQDFLIPASSAEATKILSEFRPSQNTPAALQTILSTKADPNILIGSSGMTPLHNIVAFARRSHVGEMRRLLLEAGATENNDMKKRWELRSSADASDDAWVANFHQEPALVPDMVRESQ